MDAAFVDNTTYEQQEGAGMTQPEEQETVGDNARELFANWKVGTETYRLKLTPPDIMDLEKVYKRNLLNLMGDMDHLPALTTMLQITHAAMKNWHHGVKMKTVESLYARYIENGGSQMQFYVEVFMKIYAVSGFFSTAMSEELSEGMDEVAGNM